MWRTRALLTSRCTHFPSPQQSHPRTPGPFPKGLQGLHCRDGHSVMYGVMWPGLGAVLQGCGFHGFQRHVDPSKDGAISRVVCLLRSDSVPQCSIPALSLSRDRALFPRRSWVVCVGSFSRKEVVPWGHWMWLPLLESLLGAIS